MKADPYAGRFEYMAKVFADRLNTLGEAIEANGGAVPEAWHQSALALIASVAKTWRGKEAKVFIDLGELCKRWAADGLPPGRDEFPAEHLAAQVLARPLRRKDGSVLHSAASNLGATPEDVVAEAKRRGIKGVTPVLAQRALTKEAARLGLKPRKGRKRGAKTSKEAARLRKLRKGREGKGDAGLSEM